MEICAKSSHLSVGGNTDIENLCLLCRSCHHQIHDDGWEIVRRKGGKFALKPPPRHLHPAPAPTTTARPARSCKTKGLTSIPGSSHTQKATKHHLGFRAHLRKGHQKPGSRNAFSQIQPMVAVAGTQGAFHICQNGRYRKGVTWNWLIGW